MRFQSPHFIGFIAIISLLSIPRSEGIELKQEALTSPRIEDAPLSSIALGATVAEPTRQPSFSPQVTPDSPLAGPLSMMAALLLWKKRNSLRTAHS